MVPFAGKENTPFWKDWSRRAVDWLLPPLCPVSDLPVARPGGLHPEAFARLRFLHEPACARCFFPFAFEVEARTLCGACVGLPEDQPLARIRAALAYDDVARDLILGFKWGQRADAVDLFGRWMVAVGAPLLEESPLLIPVPLHPRRLRQRRFNQAQLLARGMADVNPMLEVDTGTLDRLRYAPPQVKLSRAARARNVRGAFRVRDAERVTGRHIVLVDDVYTTGATLEACARTLMRAGAVRVDAVCLARVIIPGQATI